LIGRGGGAAAGKVDGREYGKGSRVPGGKGQWRCRCGGWGQRVAQGGKSAREQGTGKVWDPAGGVFVEGEISLGGCQPLNRRRACMLLPWRLMVTHD
jgi:hypothetical protein